MNIKEALRHAQEAEVSHRDAELLLAHILNTSLASLIAHPERELDMDSKKFFLDGIQKLRDYVPLAYLRGYKEFMGLNIIVDENVLVPRPETELMVDAALEKIKDTENPNILEIGTGSGCISVALGHSRKDAIITATDISKTTLKIAKKNVAQYHLEDRITLVTSDLLNGVANKQSFDLIIANLPYLPSDIPADISTSREPALALYAEDGGLSLYKKLIEELEHLGFAWALFEADPRNIKRLSTFLATKKWVANIDLRKDYASHPRFLIFQRNAKIAA